VAFFVSHHGKAETTFRKADIMGIKITKAEHDALPDSLKTQFKPEGDGFVLEDEDVTGLKAKRDELLADLKRVKDDAAAKAERLAALEREQAKIEDEKLTKKGEWDALRERMEAKHAEEVARLQKEIETRDQAQAERDLQMKLVTSGVKPKYAEDLAAVLKSKHIKPVNENGKMLWRTLDDTETVDLDKFIPTLRDTKGDFFESTLTPGSGASGGHNKGVPPTKDVAMGVDPLAAAYANSSKT
jgi:hypothetical protein